MTMSQPMYFIVHHLCSIHIMSTTSNPGIERVQACTR